MGLASIAVGREGEMLLTVLLICAVVASLAAGVLLAYWICFSMFHIFRIHATRVAVRRVALREAQAGQ